MRTQYLDLRITTSLSLEKPWRLVNRTHDLGGTDYETICYLTTDMAQNFFYDGIADFLHGEPDWDKFYADLEVRKAKAKLKEAEEKLTHLGE
jgi:hypothetical protein